MTLRILAAAGLFLAAGEATALANDTMANTASGGLVFETTDAVAMVSEDLAISQKEIVVRYVFRNISEADVTSTVAFPMPDVTIEPYEGDRSVPSGDINDPIAFTTLVDGKPVEMAREKRAVVGDIDVTEKLTALGLPLEPFGEAADARLNALGVEARKDALRSGLAVTEEGQEGDAWDQPLIPHWTFRATYHWTQTFPAGREVRVEHRYEPSVYSNLGTMLGDADFAAETAALRKTYCIDDALMATLAKATKTTEFGQIPYAERHVDYVLVTGANWARPIGDFRLTVDKGSPKHLVSFCAEGVTKTGPTTFEMRKTDFTPTEDLNVLILVPTGG
ncbi:DUF4424 domain-containing protein [Aurantimonas sp. 22II-16-19i]|uniref:DUF4424 domain-containing protein n=1 Tax=Aurantimonas sp. 22II-16-19i TaxID=1317114 RepID=UPI0009F7D762|nr:DUF4424 domain-containing protein [Aurantimonas sp. 22II-16-19i]ORE98337.1 hypothetical protein ATO4_05117 [Aurantimonas sp. 22II-16-19i]